MDTGFKGFAYELFMKHRDECKWYRLPCKYQTFGQYFRKNKWFIKKQYKLEGGKVYI